MALNTSNPVFRKINTEVNAEPILETNTNTASFGGVLIKTAILFAVAVLSGALFVALTYSGVIDLVILVPVVAISPLIAFVFAMIGSFSVKAAPVCSVIYSAAEGIFLGVLCAIVDLAVPGIFLVAISTLAVIFGVMLVLYSVKAIRATSKFYRTLMIMGAAVFGIVIVNLILSFFVSPVAELMSNGLIWLVIIIDVVMLIYGALMLIADFDRATALAESGAPKKMEWQASLGLMVTLIWIFIYILRILLYIVALFGRKN